MSFGDTGSFDTKEDAIQYALGWWPVLALKRSSSAIGRRIWACDCAVVGVGIRSTRHTTIMMSASLRVIAWSETFAQSAAPNDGWENTWTP
jgi:hypothetical protein